METFSYDDGNGGLVSEEARSECNGDNDSKATRFAFSSDGGGDNDRTVVSERGPWVSSSRLFFFPRLFPLFLLEVDSHWNSWRNKNFYEKLFCNSSLLILPFEERNVNANGLVSFQHMCMC